MSDTEGLLPGSRAHDLRGAIEPGAARLPTVAEGRQGEQSLPPSATGNQPPGAPSTEGQEAIRPDAPPKVPQVSTPEGSIPSTREERLAAATLAGGLTVLPASFGDTDGDWVTVRSENPFEVLYLDYRRADRITPEIVGRHRDLLDNFWQEKLKSMSQGAARVAIATKYGGEHQSERLVRSYPDLIDRAFHRLSTLRGIEEAYREIVAKQQRAVFARMDEKLSDYLVDLVLQPQETLALFEFADREGVAREVVAAHVQERIRAAGLVSETEVSGATLEQQLLSSAWVHPSRKTTVQVIAVPPPRGGMASFLLFSLPLALVLIIGVALFSSRLKSSSQIEDGRDETPPVLVVPATQKPPREMAKEAPKAPPLAPAPAPDELPRPAPGAIDEPEAVPPTRPPEVKAPPPQPEVSVEDRRAVQSELEEIRTLISADPSSALERAQRLEPILMEHAEELGNERVDLANLRAQIEAAKAKLDTEMRAQREWERRLAEIDSLSKQGNFSGAKSLADRLLGEQDVPEPIAVRARKLADEAVSKLQAIFSGAKVKSKTVRSSDPPH
jgi:predicted Holliday junction resolvase-like endonuclease